MRACAVRQSMPWCFRTGQLQYIIRAVPRPISQSRDAQIPWRRFPQDRTVAQSLVSLFFLLSPVLLLSPSLHTRDLDFDSIVGRLCQLFLEDCFLLTSGASPDRRQFASLTLDAAKSGTDNGARLLLGLCNQRHNCAQQTGLDSA